MTALKKYSLLIIWTSLIISCTGQSNTETTPAPFKQESIGETVSELDPKATLVYQDSKNNYWFASKEKGVYRYDGKSLVFFTSKDGFISSWILGVQEDKSGNIFFDTQDGISRFDGQKFTPLEVMEDNSSGNEWKLEPGDLWFRMGWDSNGPYRYDGQKLHHLKFPKSPLEDEFYAKYPNVSYNPYGIYSIYEDHKGSIWFGTSSLGIYRYDGKKLSWMYEQQLTETPEGGAFGIRSITEDANGYFWICNTNYKFRILPDSLESIGLQPIHYKRETGIEIPGKEAPYFMSMVADDNGDIWMASYLEGVWRSNGKELIHYPVKDGEKDIPLFSIYKDIRGELWVATHEDGPYKFNGKTFEKFKLDQQ